MLRFSLFTAVTAVMLTASLFAQDSLDRGIGERAAEIVPFLLKEPFCIGSSITNRTAWEAIPSGNVINDAEKLITMPIPDLPESLYKEYYRNGNRTNYQKIHGQKYRRLSLFVLAECLENKGRFILPLEETIRSICADPSWLLPAHDRNADNYNGKTFYIDLASSSVSAELGLAVSWLGEKLSPEIKTLIQENVERRTFQPYEQSVKSGNKSSNWWITGTNNWNAVCHSGVVCAALTLIDDPKRRAWYIAAAEKFMKPFLDGFTPDGYCSEGVGYWNYGFGHFVELAEIVYQATGEHVDFFMMPKVPDCALFAPRMEIAAGLFAAFADCRIDIQPSRPLLKFLNRRMEWGYNDYDKYKNIPDGRIKSTAVFCFPNSAGKMPETLSVKGPIDDLRSEFPDAGVVIYRPKHGAAKQLAAVCKAGHNAEHHNHNDVGSFTVVYAGTMPILDPGGEVYTARTFGNKRYDSNLINSFGHPVPVINGHLQKTGRDAKGKIVTKTISEEKDGCVIDYAAAYGLKELKKLCRTFEFTRSESVPNSLTVIDEAELNSAGTFETALMTYEPWKLEKSGETIVLTVGQPNKTVSVTVIAAAGEEALPLEFTAVEIDEDSTTGKKPTRFSFAVKKPVEQIRITTVIKP